MTVVSSVNPVTYAGDGVQDVFFYNFKVFRSEDIAAVICDEKGVQTSLVAGSDFRVISGVGCDSGGEIRYPLEGPPLAKGSVITLYRNVDYTQGLELVDNDPFSAALLNEAFDLAVMRDQQLQEQISRALMYDISTPESEQLSPQKFMQEVTLNRNATESAMNNAQVARDEALSSQDAAKGASDRAVAAQNAAEAARDSAQHIVAGDFTMKTPAISGPDSANEGESIIFTIENYCLDQEYVVSTTGGSVSRDGAKIIWTTPWVDELTKHCLNVYATKAGYLRSADATMVVFVADVHGQLGPTMTIADSSSGWPGADVSDEGILPPAYSAVGDNNNQIYLAKMEIEQTAGAIDLTESSRSHFVTDAPVGMEAISTDQGNCIIDNVSCSSEADCIPAMTSNVTEGFAIHGSQSGVADSQPWNVGDKDLNTWCAMDKTKHMEFWFQPSSAKIIMKYEVTARTDFPDQAPTKWQLQGQTIDGEWVSLGFVILDTPWEPGEKRTFTIDKIVPCINYSIMVHSTASTDNYMSFAEFALIAGVGPFVADISSAGFNQAPSKVFRNLNPGMKLGYGVFEEYVGPEKVLELTNWGPNAIPEMTGPTTDGCTISSSSSVIGDLWKIADGKNTTYATFYASTAPKDVIITFDTAKVISNYTFQRTNLTDSDTNKRLPHTWELFYLNSAGKWVSIESRINPSCWGKEAKYVYPLPSALKAKAFKFVFGVAEVDENYLDIPSIELITVRESTPSTLYFASDTSIKNDIFISGREHNKLLCAGVATSVSAIHEDILHYADYEKESPHPLFITTATLSKALVSVPTVVKLPDRYTESPSGYNFAVIGERLRITADEIILPENLDIRRVGMAVKPLVKSYARRFKSGRIYIKEKI